MTIAVVAEKPAVARDLARVLGASQRGEGYLHGGGYVVTWAIGHLVALAQPHQIDPAWKRWRLETLPMLPSRWPLEVLPDTKDQFEVVKKILGSTKVAEVIAATDAGREGELIFRYVYEAAGCTKPVRRLWISSLTPDAIRDGFRRLRQGKDLDPLADAARGRSRADWLVGLNLSRAYSLAFDQDLSVGRVQTPTLAMVVEREKAIRSFVPEDYLEVVGTFLQEGKDETSKYEGTWFREEGEKRNRRLPADGKEAARIVERTKRGQATIASVERDTRRLPPPLLYDLTELQRHANRLYGMSAQRTLDVAQSLYETHKLISYPRTDSRHLSADVAGTLGPVVQAIEAPYAGLLAPGTGQRPLSRRFVDDAKVTDHHAIIPTATTGRRGPRRGRAQGLRSRLPAPALGVARRSRLRGHDRDHGGGRERGGEGHRRSLRELGHGDRSTWGGRCSTSAAGRGRRRRRRRRRARGERRARSRARARRPRAAKASCRRGSRRVSARACSTPWRCTSARAPLRASPRGRC